MGGYAGTMINGCAAATTWHPPRQLLVKEDRVIPGHHLQERDGPHVLAHPAELADGVTGGLHIHGSHVGRDDNPKDIHGESNRAQKWEGTQTENGPLPLVRPCKCRHGYLTDHAFDGGHALAVPVGLDIRPHDLVLYHTTLLLHPHQGRHVDGVRPKHEVRGRPANRGVQEYGAMVHREACDHTICTDLYCITRSRFSQ